MVDFHKRLAGGKFVQNALEKRFYPIKKHPIHAIPDTEPYHLRATGVHQDTFCKVIILCDDNPCPLLSKCPYLGVSGFAQTDLAYGLGFMPLRPQPTGKGWRQLSINKESHTSACHEHGMVHIARRVGNTSTNISDLQVREVAQDFLL